MDTNVRSKGTTLLVYTALLTALTTIATLFFRIPTGNGYIHLGDAMVLLGAMMLPRKHALFSGAVGAALADVISGYSVWAPWTLIIKMCMVLIMQAALKRAANYESTDRHIFSVPVPELIGFILAGVETVCGYFIAEALIYGNWVSALIGMPLNALQVFVGAVLAVVISRMLYHTSVGSSFQYKRK